MFGDIEKMNGPKHIMLRNATSTCSETSASVPGFLRTHVEEETMKSSIILVDPLLHRFVIFVFIPAFLR